jgi:TolA-binding protein
VKFSLPTAALAAFAVFSAAPALAQREVATPEQRLERLERQLNQVQRQVFPRGRPADTAGFALEPAATQTSVATLNQRLDSLERQMTDIVRLSEENGQRLRTIESDAARARVDQEARLATLEQRISEAAAAAAATPAPIPTQPATRPTSKPATTKPTTKPTTAGAKSATGDLAPAGTLVDPGEEAYTEGFKLWEAGNYDQAITSLRAFTSAYPNHRRLSYANNLVGRALLDTGQARAAAEALLANYRTNPRGERAADSLYYLGQALMQLGQPGQACKVYSELDAVYGAKVRADLKQLVQAAQAKAQCS